MRSAWLLALLGLTLTAGAARGDDRVDDVTSLALTGRFDYQACDDKVCFTRQSVPLSWTIGVNIDRADVVKEALDPHVTRR